LWARGDRNLGRLLITAFKKGCRFDGWSDKFNFNKWMEAIEDESIDMEYYTERKRDPLEPLPWDHIDAGITKEYLIEELEQAKHRGITEDCRNGNCSNCGICDFKNVRPVIFSRPQEKKWGAEQAETATHATGTTPTGKIQIFYSKKGNARFFGHLELGNIIARAIRRAGIRVKFSEGFHPKPKISFDDALPVGTESLCESFTAVLQDGLGMDEIKHRMNKKLPEGLFVNECKIASPGKSGNGFKLTRYSVRLHGEKFDKARMEEFLNSRDWNLTKRSRKGKLKKIDLKDMVELIAIDEPKTINLTLKTYTDRIIRPSEVVKSIFNLSEEALKKAIITKQHVASVNRGMGECIENL